PMRCSCAKASLTGLDVELRELEPDHGREAQGAVARPDRAHPAAGREDEPPGPCVLVAVVRSPRPAADHLGHVVLAPQQAAAVEVEALLAGMGVESVREADRQPPPRLAVLPPGVRLPHLD